jgi:acetylglutamate kinase
VKAVIKLGGTLLEDPALRNSLAAQLAEASRSWQIAIVHGGGKQVTRFLEDRGIRSRFVNGLRVSDEAVIDAVVKVIAGTVNQQLVSALVAAGANAVGLSGADGPLTIAEQMQPELGNVGRPVRTDARLLDLLSGSGYLPAIACIASDREGNVYNVNADQMAVSCAGDWGAEMLLFLTDVPGVRDGAGEILPELTVAESRALVASGAAHGGMQAKLEAAEAGLRRGIGEVCIAPGREADICARLLAGDFVGTRIHKSREAA